MRETSSSLHVTHVREITKRTPLRQKLTCDQASLECAFTQRLNLGTFGNLWHFSHQQLQWFPLWNSLTTKTLKTLCVHNVTWISWILLKPSLQKNSTRLDKVLGPGISFSALVFPRTFVGAISLSDTASSPAAVIPNDSLAADLCKTRKTKNICLLSRSPWKFLQHAVVNVLRMAIVFFWYFSATEFNCSFFPPKRSAVFKSTDACPWHVRDAVLPPCVVMYAWIRLCCGTLFK